MRRRVIGNMMGQPTGGGGGLITTGLAARWLFNEGTGTTAADSVGTNDATLQGTATWETTSPLEGAASLKIVTNNIDNVPTLAENYGVFDDFAVAVYINKDATIDSYDGILTWRNDGAKAFLAFGHSNFGRLSIYVADGVDYEQVESTNGLFVAGSYRVGVRVERNGSVYFYKDGTEYSGDGVITIQCKTAFATGRIGGDPALSNRAMMGVVDDLRLYIDTGSGIPTRAQMQDITSGNG